MAQLRLPHYRSPSTNFPSSVPSMLYSILPSAVQSRLPRLPSLRSSASKNALPTRILSPKSTSSSGSSTPSSDPDYKRAVVLTGHEGDYSIESAIVGSESERSLNFGYELIKEKRGQATDLNEGSSGVEWKFASQGLNLLGLAADESASISQDPRFGNASFVRQLYIHSITYLLRGLPTDLTIDEQLSIRASLPIPIINSLRLECDPSSLPQSTNPPTSQPSVLHRTLAITIVQLFLLLQLLLPHLKHLLRAAYQYDREHKVSEKIMAHGIDTVDKTGKSTLTVAKTLWGMGDGKVGQVLGEFAKWFLEGVAGGLHEGIGEGLALLGGGTPDYRKRWNES